MHFSSQLPEGEGTMSSRDGNVSPDDFASFAGQNTNGHHQDYYEEDEIDFHQNGYQEEQIPALAPLETGKKEKIKAER